MEEVPLNDDITSSNTSQQLNNVNLSVSHQVSSSAVHPALVHATGGVTRPGLIPLLHSEQPSTTTDRGTSTMSLGDRERLLQQQISRLLPALQQSAINHLPQELRQNMAPQQQQQQQQQQQHAHAHTHSHAHSHAHHTHAVPPPPPPPSSPPVDMAINVEDNGPLRTNNNDAPPEDGSNQAAGAGNGTTNRARRPGGRRQLGDTLQGLPGLGALLRNFEGAVPFLLLLFAKVMYNHRLGLLVFIAMFGTFYYANSSLKKLIALRDNQTWAEALSGYVWIFGFLAANILFIYFVFSEEALYRSLYWQTPNLGELDLWNLMWITVITDFVVKFGTISLKSLIAILPKHIMAFKKKGKYFLFLEMLSQFYRCMLPIPRWAEFMLEDRFGGRWVAYILFILYCIFKAFHIKKKALELKAAFAQIRVDVSFGTSPTREEIKLFDNTCPICQDLFTEPVKLSCNHVFCDDCICLWLDREKTCPMCRAHIVDNPVWRDGATSALVQFY